MRYFLPCLFTFILFYSPSVWAAVVTPFQECVTLRNAVPHSVIGVIRTAGFKNKRTGQVSYHEGPFVLNEDEIVEICSNGPFYPGYKVELTIRTLMPLFSCQTRLSGEIVIRQKIEDGIKFLYADCK